MRSRCRGLLLTLPIGIAVDLMKVAGPNFSLFTRSHPLVFNVPLSSALTGTSKSSHGVWCLHRRCRYPFVSAVAVAFSLHAIRLTLCQRYGYRDAPWICCHRSNQRLHAIQQPQYRLVCPCWRYCLCWFVRHCASFAWMLFELCTAVFAKAIKQHLGTGSEWEFEVEQCNYLISIH